MAESVGPILHVIVVGFHHKKGCQVEFSYPPLVSGAPQECPEGWKYLPTLALPDGSHNYDEDTVYFHLPSLTDPNQTIFGVSCFKQIPVEKLVKRTSDLTRGTVQKSVCVLSTMPIYGHIQVKMALITHAYFEEGDFSRVSLLEETYEHLNTCMNLDGQTPPQIFIGLSARDFILQFKHKALLLFKLLLLEKKILFYHSPVLPLCSAILTLLSLYPGMIENGLEESACIRPSKPMSPLTNFENKSTNKQSHLYQFDSVSNFNIPDVAKIITDNSFENLNNYKDYRIVKNLEKISDVKKINKNLMLRQAVAKENSSSKNISSSDFLVESQNNFIRDVSDETIIEAKVMSTIAQIANINPNQCGMPLNLFSKGYLCLPYLSLPYLDVLGDENVRGYIIGASNVLFKQKKNFVDVLVEVENTRIEANDTELRRQLHLTMEDLRFADYIVRHVSEPKNDTFFDGVDWEGGDEWIRNQFRVYLLCLLRTSLEQDARLTDHYNAAFINAWRETQNYKMWAALKNTKVTHVEPGHPFSGQMSVQDMKLRISHTMQTTEGGRKLNQAMITTSRAVSTTGKAVGGAFSQAKGAFSNWLTNFTTVPQELDNQVQSEITKVSIQEQQISDILTTQNHSEVQEIGIEEKDLCVQPSNENL